MISRKINQKIILLLAFYLINNFSPALSNIVITSISNDEMLLHAPIKFTSSGINCFLKHTYNHKKYATDILPHNTGHLIQMLEHGKRTKQDHEYMIAVIRLFRQKLSSAEYISAVEVERITGLIPTILEKYLNGKLAKQNRSDRRRLRNLVLRLIESSISKTLWDSEEPEQMLNQILHIGNNLENMLAVGIMRDEDDLNDVIHMLIDRLIYVIDIVGADLPLSFYQKLKVSLEKSTWMQLEEIEELVTSKLEKINNACFKSKIKSHAADIGGIL